MKSLPHQFLASATIIQSKMPSPKTQRATALIATLLTLPAITQAAPPNPNISAPTTDANGFLIHTIQSPYQAGEVKLRVLLPDKLDPSRKYRTLYLLPVEARDGNRYGDGLLEAKKTDLHNKHQLICVAPTFSHLPWYADHPTDKDIQQESHFLKVVIPAVEEHYPALKQPAGRLLAGFSKSGWGAWSLFLRHPDKFHKAAAWDAPLMKAAPNQFGMGPIFGTQENFEAYEITRLLKKNSKRLAKQSRLIHTGYGGFRQHHQQMQKLLKEQHIPCEYRDGPQRKHHWNSGWLAEAVELLVNQPDR